MCSTSSSLARYMVMHAVRKCVYPFLLHVQPLAHALAISHMHVWLTNLSQSIQRQKVCGTRLEKGKRYDFSTSSFHATRRYAVGGHMYKR